MRKRQLKQGTHSLLVGVVAALVLILFVSLCVSAQTDDSGKIKPKPQSGAPKPAPKTPPQKKQSEAKRPSTVAKPQQPKDAQVTVAISEPGAEVYLTDRNGHSVLPDEFETSPADGSAFVMPPLKNGTYTLTVRKEGFFDFSQQISVAGRPIPLDVRLKPSFAYLTITCTNVSDATIEIDGGVGRFVGGVKKQPVKPGTYHVTISHKGYLPITSTLQAVNLGMESNFITPLQHVPTEPMLADARRSFDLGDNEKAAAICRDVLDLESNNRAAVLLLGYVLYQMGDRQANTYLVNALRLGETVSLAANLYVENGRRILAARLILDRSNLRVEVPTAADQNFWIFKPDFRSIQQKNDRQNLKMVAFQARGDNGNGKKSDKTISLYSANVYYREKSRETFCQARGNASPTCDADADNLWALINGWQSQMR